MRLRFTKRRFVAAAVSACVVIFVPAVALAASGSHARAAAQPCAESSTYVWLALAPQGAAGTIYYPVEFTNIGSTTCTLRGFPGVSAITKTDHQLGPAAGRITTSVRTDTLKPGQTVNALLGIVEPGIIAGCHGATAFGLKVYPPNQKEREFVGSFTFSACTNKVFLHVYPVAAGIGVP